MTTRRGGLSVGVIGAGFGGVIAAVKLKKVGIRATVYDKADVVGGVWKQRYPGVAVDAPAHLYSFTFKRDYDWSSSHPSAPEVQRYVEETVDQFGLRGQLRLGHEVRRVTWDDDRHDYELEFADGTTVRHDVVVSAVGLFHTPRHPQWPGMDDYTGTIVHTAEWPEQLDLTGRTVAVVGTGSSSIQLVPRIARDVEQLYVFQREPGWMLPKPYKRYSEAERRHLMRPLGTTIEMAKWYFEHERLITGIRKPGPVNEHYRKLAENYIGEMLADHPEIRQAVTPTYSFGGKRPLRDIREDSFYTALTRDNVELVPRAVTELTEKGIVDADGLERAVDVIVTATGYRVSDFLLTLDVRGTGGIDIQRVWDGEPRAFLGIMVPRFPNFFMMYGPNTNGGTVSGMLEIEGGFIARTLRDMQRTNSRVVEPRPWASEAWDWYVSRLNRKSVLGAARNAYYFSSTGRIVSEWVNSQTEFLLWSRLGRRIGLEFTP